MDHNLVIILGACLAVSEALSLIPAIKANGIIQMVFGVLKSIMPKQ
jgi:hypothetical protein